MSKHTPGPWEAEHYRTERDSREPGYYAIASAVLDHHRGSVADTLNRDHRISPDEDAANARLIAAAPALLEALQKIISEGDFTAPEGMKRIASDAIAKATQS